MEEEGHDVDEEQNWFKDEGFVERTALIQRYLLFFVTSVLNLLVSSCLCVAL